MNKMNETVVVQALEALVPLDLSSLDLSAENKVGLIVVDEVNGFCTVGMGNLVSRSLIHC